MHSRYSILGSLASGGMGTVYLAKLAGSAGFSRLVAVKRLHPHLALERDFIAMLVDEARLASQIRHANVIDTLDLEVSDGTFSLVLEYIDGVALSTLIRGARSAGEGVPRPIAMAILRGTLRGLEAAHEARSAEGRPLGIVHRDVSPQNVLVGVDGIPRLIDFGIAKAMGKVANTRPGEVRGKFSYMAPEQLHGRPVTRQADVYSAGVVLWELLTGATLFEAEDARTVIAAVLQGGIQPPSSCNPEIPLELDAVVLKATARDVAARFETAREMLDALAAWSAASDEEVGAWVRRVGAAQLARTNALLQKLVPEASRSVEDLVVELEQAHPASMRMAGRTVPAAPALPSLVSDEDGNEVTTRDIVVATGREVMEPISHRGADTGSVHTGSLHTGSLGTGQAVVPQPIPGWWFAVGVAGAFAVGALALGGVLLGTHYRRSAATSNPTQGMPPMVATEGAAGETVSPVYPGLPTVPVPSEDPVAAMPGGSAAANLAPTEPPPEPASSAAAPVPPGPAPQTGNLPRRPVSSARPGAPVPRPPASTTSRPAPAPTDSDTDHR